MLVYSDQYTLTHYGMPRRSGRYPWGSGEHPYQSAGGFLSRVKELRKEGLSETEIAKAMGLGEHGSAKLRALSRIAREEMDLDNRNEALTLKDKGWSNVAIAKKLGVTEGTVRNLLKPVMDARRDKVDMTAQLLADNIGENGVIDVGVGTERLMGISRTQLKTAIALLKEDGYHVYYSKVEQLGTGKETSLMVLAAPDVTYNQFNKNKENIKIVNARSEDGGDSFYTIEPPRSVSSSRITINYAEDGGVNKDGVIELRRGVDDISLGNARYAQVRIAVDGTHYLKGMAMYSDDLPDGVDIRFNTNKHRGTPMMDPDDKASQVLKPLKKTKDGEVDEENPFGAAIKTDSELILAQRHYTDKDGKTQLSAINVVNEEGDWANWRKAISSQVLSKQDPSLAKEQLKISYDTRRDEYDEIMSLTNPAIKKKLLDSFADNCDSAAVHLKAAALPRQASHVILPFEDMSENEIYAPNYRDGEKVVLIRYPHGGKFEIPELTVNNRQKSAKKALGDSPDAVGINAKVAEQLSGADFDGDTVLVIPNNSRRISTKPPLSGLKDFNPKEKYSLPADAPNISERRKGMLMGDVSNLITDMTIKGATDSEIERAVKHSMVVIDAKKHHLDYKQSEIDNGIAELKQKYQGGAKRGASTLISRASSTQYVNERVEGIDVVDPVSGKKRKMYTDPATGKKLYTETGNTKKAAVKDDEGNIVGYKDTGKPRQTKSTKMYEAEDALTLSSGTRIEKVYGDYANQMKALGNQARKSSLSVEPTKYDPTARRTYQAEVDSLNAKLDAALRNAPLERKAQVVANNILNAKREANPDMDADDVKKARGQALVSARARLGAKKERISITDQEWTAIQAGAISYSKLGQILDNTDLDRVKELATPRTSVGLSAAKVARARTYLNNGYTQSEVADMLGVSVSTLNNSLKGN